MYDPWQAHIPAVFRALADPAQREQVPRPCDADFEYALATWGALHYTLSSLLGWRNVGAGLAWWYGAGQPTDESPVLELVKRVWGVDDLIDYYAAWTWRPEGACHLYSQAESPFDGPSPTALALNSHWQDEGWWRAFVRRGRVHHSDPFYGGTDPLHLQLHDRPTSYSPSRDPLVQVLPQQRRAVLVTGGLDYWMADLRQLEEQLPPLENRSWRVEIFDRKVGWLGEYRKSRVTGRWFTGKHRIHMRGNAAT